MNKRRKSSVFPAENETTPNGKENKKICSEIGLNMINKSPIISPIFSDYPYNSPISSDCFNKKPSPFGKQMFQHNKLEPTIYEDFEG